MTVVVGLRANTVRPYGGDDVLFRERVGGEENMRFRGMPKTCVIDYAKNTVVGVFDGNGYLEIENAAYIVRMKKRFKIVRKKPQSKEVKET